MAGMFMRTQISLIKIGLFVAIFSVFSVVCQAQEPVEKLDIDVSKPVVKGNHLPSPKTSKANSSSATAKPESVSGETPGDRNRIVTAVAANKNESRAGITKSKVTASGGDSLIDENISAENSVKETSANKLNAVARRENLKARIAARPLTEIYRVGTGDILDIRLLNVSSKDSTLFTVMEGGLLDYPLAGEPIAVEGMTPEEIADLLIEKIKLYESPEIIVNVRDFASHKITITGLIEKPGVKLLRREEVPLFVILAEAIQHPEAASADIIRADKQTLSVNLEELTNDVRVRNGDMIRISGKSAASKQTAQFYFIGGAVAVPGQKDFHSGLTLTQAVLAAGGTKKGNSVIVSRQNAEGLLISFEYNLKQIKTGKAPDPLVQQGDRIEIKN